MSAIKKRGRALREDSSAGYFGILKHVNISAKFSRFGLLIKKQVLELGACISARKSRAWNCLSQPGETFENSEFFL